MTESVATSITQYVNQNAIQENIKTVLKDRTPQFIASIVSLVNANEMLKKADKKSLLGACLTAASMNLPINSNLGFAYIIPYKQKDGSFLAQFQMGYKGFVQLAIRSGQYRTINTADIREGEVRKIDHLSGEVKFRFIEENREAAPIVGYVAMFKLKSGFAKMLYMTRDDLKKHGLKYSQNFKKYNSGLWADDFDSMAKKTVLKLLLSKYGVLDTDLAKALESDQALIADGQISYPDNEPLKPEDEADAREIERIRKFIANAKTLDDLSNCEEAVDGSMNDELIELFVAKKKELQGVK
jgi:recombination protein RecT